MLNLMRIRRRFAATGIRTVPGGAFNGKLGVVEPGSQLLHQVEGALLWHEAPLIPESSRASSPQSALCRSRMRPNTCSLPRDVAIPADVCP